MNPNLKAINPREKEEKEKRGREDGEKEREKEKKPKDDTETNRSEEDSEAMEMDSDIVEVRELKGEGREVDGAEGARREDSPLVSLRNPFFFLRILANRKGSSVISTSTGAAATEEEEEEGEGEREREKEREGERGGRGASKRKQRKMSTDRNYISFLSSLWLSHFSNALSLPYYEYPCFPFAFQPLLDRSLSSSQSSPLLHLLLIRAFDNITQTQKVREDLRNFFQSKVSRMKKRDFLGTISVVSVALGKAGPQFGNFRFIEEVCVWMSTCIYCVHTFYL